jgi:hypothetical protein
MKQFEDYVEKQKVKDLFESKSVPNETKINLLDSLVFKDIPEVKEEIKIVESKVDFTDFINSKEIIIENQNTITKEDVSTLFEKLNKDEKEPEVIVEKLEEPIKQEVKPKIKNKSKKQEIVESKNNLKVDATIDAINKIAESINNNRNIEYEFKVKRDNQGIISSIYAKPIIKEKI